MWYQDHRICSDVCKKKQTCPFRPFILIVFKGRDDTNHSKHRTHTKHSIIIDADQTNKGLCNRRGSKTLETAHPEKPTLSGFRAKNYKIRLGWNVLIPLNPKFQVDWSTTSWDIHHWFGSRNFVFVLILHLILLFFSSNFTRSGSVSSLGLPQSAYLVLLH